jgi:GT2 family glycosyltransferase
MVADKNRVYGPLMFKREVVEAVGLFPESYDAYGEDFDFNERVNRAGFNSFFIPGLRANHIGGETGPATRKMKDESCAKNLTSFWARHAQWEAGASIKEPLPEMREPLT